MNGSEQPGEGKLFGGMKVAVSVGPLTKLRSWDRPRSQCLATLLRGTHLAQDCLVKESEAQIQAKVDAEVRIFRSGWYSIFCSMFARAQLRFRWRTRLLRLDVSTCVHLVVFFQESLGGIRVVGVVLPVGVHDGLVRRRRRHFSCGWAW